MDNMESRPVLNGKYVCGEWNGPVHVWRFEERECMVLVPHRVLEDMRRMGWDALPNETGGTLVGHYSSDLRVALVERALGVRVCAQRSPVMFFRPPDDVDGQLSEIYRESGGRVYYLGEWHTHPYAAPTPSVIDLNTLCDLARAPSVATDTPIMIILGWNFVADPPGTCILAEPSGRCLWGRYEKFPKLCSDRVPH